MKSQDFEFYILGHRPQMSAEAATLYDQAFAYWVKFWENFWQETSAQQTPSRGTLAETFYRQDVAGVLFHQSQIVGMVLQTRYDLRLQSIRDLPYFLHYPENVFPRLHAAGISTLATHEFLTVDKAWRKHRQGFSLAEWLMILAGKTLPFLGAQGSLAMARKDIGVSQLCKRLGWHVLEPDLEYRGYPCDMIALQANSLASPPDLDREINDLWLRRQDFIGITAPTASPSPAMLRLAA